MAPTDQVEPGAMRVAAVPRDVKRALDHMRDGLDERVTTAALAAACGVSERTLRRHFRRFIGLPPLAHWRRLRLAAARAELLTSEGGASVTEVALRLGFLHLGRFAADYARRFGEPPSGTLCRTRSISAARQEQQGVLRPYLARQAPSLVILPFEMATATCRLDPAFPHDLAEQIAVGLGRLDGIAATVARPGAVSSAPYGLAGRISHAGGVRVVVRLFQVSSGRHLWGDSYEGSADAALALRDRVVMGVVHDALPKLRDAEIERTTRSRPDAPDAHNLVLRALPMVLPGTRFGTDDPLRLLDRAMELDPDHAPAVALAAWCHAKRLRAHMFNRQGSPASGAEAKARALHLAERAAALGSADSLVLTARGAVARAVGDDQAADALVARALATDPSAGWAWEQSGWLRNAESDPGIAIAHFDRAIRHTDAGLPHEALAGIGCAHFIAGRYGEATLWLRKHMRAHPTATWLLRQIAASYALLGERRAALGALDTLRRAHPNVTLGSIAAVSPPNAACRDRTVAALAGLGLPS